MFLFEKKTKKKTLFLNDAASNCQIMEMNRQCKSLAFCLKHSDLPEDSIYLTGPHNKHSSQRSFFFLGSAPVALAQTHHYLLFFCNNTLSGKQQRVIDNSLSRMICRGSIRLIAVMSMNNGHTKRNTRFSQSFEEKKNRWYVKLFSFYSSSEIQRNEKKYYRNIHCCRYLQWAELISLRFLPKVFPFLMNIVQPPNKGNIKAEALHLKQLRLCNLLQILHS